MSWAILSALNIPDSDRPGGRAERSSCQQPLHAVTSQYHRGQNIVHATSSQHLSSHSISLSLSLFFIKFEEILNRNVTISF